MKKLTRHPLFWVFQVILFVVCSYSAWILYPQSFPIVDLQIKMDRITALKSAKDLAQKNHWGPPSFAQAASFEVDGETQTFVELAAGGSKAFSALLKTDYYSPYTWRIRHFTEGSAHETIIRFNPDGRFYGFHEKLPENAPGAAINSDEALKIAESSAVNEWKLPLQEYKLVEKSQETRPSKRIDHTFVYERKNNSIGEGKFRLKLVVAGNTLNEAFPYVKVPEAFNRHYAEMRSANQGIATVSTIAMAILYLFLGCGVGIFLLAREKWIIWRTPLTAAVIVGFFQLLEQWNHLPLIWTAYDTAVSSTGFLTQNLISSVFLFLAETILLSISFMAAESLSRKAFPHHPQLWQVWKTSNASSLEVLGRTIGGYLSVGFFFLFVVIIYRVGTQFFGWWNPSDTLFHPDGLATYCPWFTSIANSLHAGFWEESLFRAVPLAGAALLGQRFGNKKIWLSIAFIVQALVFAAGHANYPTQPAYARVVELIIPSFIFGGIYLAYGLLPGIILHFTFDVVSFSLPLFTANTPKIWIDRTLVILVTLIPLWIVLIARFRTKKWHPLPSKEFNGGWEPSRLIENSRTSSKTKTALSLSPRATTSLIGISVFSLLLLVFLSKSHYDSQPLQISRTDAIRVANDSLAQAGVNLSQAWETWAIVSTPPSEEDVFVWTTQPHEKYKILAGTYLSSPSWLIRKVRFDTAVEERAEEYDIFVSHQGENVEFQHVLPEARKGTELDAPSAVQLAKSELSKRYHLDAEKLKEVSSVASQLPNRKDWHITFSDPSVSVPPGEARLSAHIGGNEVLSLRRFIFVPEEWSRRERNNQNLLNILTSVSYFFLVLLGVGGVIYSIVNWTQKRFHFKAFLNTSLFVFTLGLVNLINGIPARVAVFSTSEPKSIQFFELFSFSSLKVLFSSLAAGILMGTVHWSTQNYSSVSRRLYAISSYSFGIIGGVALAVVSRAVPTRVPFIGKFFGLDYFSPFLTSLHAIDQYLFITLLFFVVALLFNNLTEHGTRRRTVGNFLLVLFSMALAAVFSDTLQGMLVTGAVAGMFVTLFYNYFVIPHLSLLPLGTAAVFCLTEWKQILAEPFQHAGAYGVMKIALVLFFSYFWHLWLEKQTKPGSSI